MVPQPQHRHHVSRPRAGAILTSALVFLAFLAASGVPVAAQAPATANPDALPAPTGPLSVAEQSIDLGNVTKNVVVPHEWTLVNTGDEPVTIERILMGTGCKAPSYDETIPAGGQGTLRTEADTWILNGKASCVFGVLLAGDDEPSLLLELDLRVVPQLLADPGFARWIYVQHEPEGTITQTIFPGDGAEFDVLGVSSPMPGVRLAFREAKEDERREDTPGSQWILEATLDDEAPLGAIRGQIVVDTDHPVQKTITIPMSGFVRPVLFVQPPSGQFGTLDPGETRHAVFDVRNFATEEVRLTGIKTDLAGVSPSIRAVDEGRRYRLEVAFDPSEMAPGPFSGTLQVTTDSEHVPTLEVPFTGRVEAPVDAPEDDAGDAGDH